MINIMSAMNIPGCIFSFFYTVRHFLLNRKWVFVISGAARQSFFALRLFLVDSSFLPLGTAFCGEEKDTAMELFTEEKPLKLNRRDRMV